MLSLLEHFLFFSLFLTSAAHDQIHSGLISNSVAALFAPKKNVLFFKSAHVGLFKWYGTCLP